MVNPLKEMFFCPQIRDNCVGKRCIAMKKKTHRWSNEGCMGGITWHSEDYHQCRHYPEVRINPGDSREDIEYRHSTLSRTEEDE